MSSRTFRHHCLALLAVATLSIAAADRADAATTVLGTASGSLIDGNSHPIISDNTPGAISFTTGSASSTLSQFDIFNGNASSTPAIVLSLYQFTGTLNGNFDLSTASRLGMFTSNTFAASDAMKRSFDLTSSSNGGGLIGGAINGSFDLAADTQYVLTIGYKQSGFNWNVQWIESDASSVTKQSGFELAGGNSTWGTYKYGGGTSWTSLDGVGYGISIPAGSQAVPGIGAFAALACGAPGVKRRRRRAS